MNFGLNQSVQQKKNTRKTYLQKWAKSLLCSDWFWPPNRTLHAVPSTATGGNPDGTRNGQHTHTREKETLHFPRGMHPRRTDGRRGIENYAPRHEAGADPRIRTNRGRRMFFDNWLAGWQFFALTLASVLLLLLFAATANVARV